MLRPLRVFSHYVSGQSLALLVGDLLILWASVLAGSWIRLLGYRGFWLGYPPIPPKAALFVLLGLLSLHVAGLYDSVWRMGRKEIAARTAAAGFLWMVLFAALAFTFPVLRLSRTATFLGFVLGTVGVILMRWSPRFYNGNRRFRERILFLGATPMAEQLIAEVEENNPGYEVLGYVDDRPPETVALSNGYRVLGHSRQLREIAQATQAKMIVVSLPERPGAFPVHEILDCKLEGVRIEDWPTFYEKLTGKIIVRDVRQSWLVFSDGFNRTRRMRLTKRVVDIVLSSLFLVVGWPLFLLVALAIKLDSKGPAFLRQERVGERGRRFILLKFRTMVDDAEALTGPVWADENDPRITRVGRWLRKTRLDEFPQFLNVLKGEMSFIGPRPERPSFVAQLQAKIPYYSQRLAIKPGITGWAQVRYRYGSTLEDAEQKLQYDLYYVKNMSAFLDTLILLHSIQVVLFGKGAR